MNPNGPGGSRALIVSIDDHHGYWGAVCLNVAGFDVSVMGARAWGVARLSSRFRAYTSCGLSPLRQSDQSLLEHINAYCTTHRIDWVVPADYPATILLARGRKRIKSAGTFPLSDPTLIETWNDKGKFAALLKGLELPTPPTLLLTSADDPARRSLPFPVMVKPVRGEGGAGVRRFDRPSDLDAALPRLGSRHGWPLLLQEFVPGSDIDLSAIADRGRIAAWTIQRRRPESGDLLEFVDHPRVLEIGAELIRRCGYHGLVHFDLRLDQRSGEPTFIEANPRFWSSLRHSMWMGVNFPALGIELARGGDLASHFQPALGLCRDPGLSIKSTFRALVRGHWGPEGLSQASSAGWHNHLRDPLPEIWRKLQGFARHHQQAIP